MEKLLDLDKLHKQHRKQKIRNTILGIGSAGLVIVIGAVIIISMHHPAKHGLAQIVGLNTASDDSGQSNAPVTNNSSSSSPSAPQQTTTYKQTASNDAAAIKNDRTEQQILDTESSECADNPVALEEENQVQQELTQLTNQMATEQQQEAQGWQASSGLTFGQWIAYWQNLNQQNSQKQQSLEQQFNAASEQVGGC